MPEETWRDMNELFVEDFAVNSLCMPNLPAQCPHDSRLQQSPLKTAPRVTICFLPAMQEQEIELIRQKGKERKPIRCDHVRQQGEFSLPIRCAHESVPGRSSSIFTS